MIFELQTVLRYLRPKRKELSRTIISILSCLVISLVVWLVLVYYSVTDGLEKRWTDRLITLSSVVRIHPSPDYYDSYYFLADRYSISSDYEYKTLSEKANERTSDPWKEGIDPPLPVELSEKRQSRHLVGETLKVLQNLKLDYSIVTTTPTTVYFNIEQVEPAPTLSTSEKLIKRQLTQGSFISSYEPLPSRMKELEMKWSLRDIEGWISYLRKSNSRQVHKVIHALNQKDHEGRLEATSRAELWKVPKALWPPKTTIEGIRILRGPHQGALMVTSSASDMKKLKKECDHKNWTHRNEKLTLPATFDEYSLNLLWYRASNKWPIRLEWVEELLLANLSFKAGGTDFRGLVPLKELRLTQTPHFQPPLKELLSGSLSKNYPLLAPRSMIESGLRVGDNAYITYLIQTPTRWQEQTHEGVIVGFYDPGIFPLGGRFLITSPELSQMVYGANGQEETASQNFIGVWTTEHHLSEIIKSKLNKRLNRDHLNDYWRIESYRDYEFSRELLTQLASDRMLLSLVAWIIILVACSSIVSMLILLVSQRQHEIAILRSMGLSKVRLMTIFAMAGAATGLAGTLFGTCLASITLHYLNPILKTLSYIQGYDLFQPAYYGETLPSVLSVFALRTVWIGTFILSVLAGILAAFKASKLHPTEVMRSP